MEKLLTKKQHSKDSEVMGAIIAGIMTSTKKVVPGSATMETSQNMCAIGAGNRGRRVTKPCDIFKLGDSNVSKRKRQLIPLIRFTTINEVSENYGCGVNDGFEDNVYAAMDFYPEVDRTSDDYERGFNVGQAVRIFCGYR